MKHSIKTWCVLALAVTLAAFAGCKKKAPGEAGAAGAAAASESGLAGGNDVMTAAEAKDYEKAMALWLQVRQNVRGPEQLNQFTVLTHELKTKLIAAATSDKKAAEALATLRGVSAGR